MSFDGYEGTPPQLPSSVVSVFDDYDVTLPQLPSTVLSVLETSGPLPKELMVSETEQLSTLRDEINMAWMYSFLPDKHFQSTTHQN